MNTKPKQHMNPELKQKWLTALRSGKYKQGKAALCRVSPDGESRSYCCLGVLNEIVHGEEAWGKKPPAKDGSIQLHYLHDSGMPQLKDMEKWGLPDACDLPARNDGAGKWHDNPQTFDQIADFIEEEY